jgi:hypothetical protein
MEKEEVKKDCCCGNCNHDENINENHTCNCGDNCTCGDNCNCGDECHCNDVDDNFDESEEVLILKNNIIITKYYGKIFSEEELRLQQENILSFLIYHMRICTI